jgi:hypothetical protein
MRDAHGELIAKLVYTSCVWADTIDVHNAVGPVTHSFESVG